MLGHSLHAEGMRRHPVNPAGGGDNIVLSGYIVNILFDEEKYIGFENYSLDYKNHFQAPFCYFFVSS